MSNVLKRRWVLISLAAVTLMVSCNIAYGRFVH